MAVACGMAALRTWSGKHLLAGLVACFVALQSLAAGLHAVRLVDMQLLANDLAAICHGGKPGNHAPAPAQPSSGLAGACCLVACSIAAATAKLPDALLLEPPRLDKTRVAPPLFHAIAHLPSHLIDRAHRPRSPPNA
jgi:hypothetical protein